MTASADSLVKSLIQNSGIGRELMAETDTSTPVKNTIRSRRVSWTDLAGRAAGFVQSPDEGRLLQSRHLSCINTVAGNHGDSRPAGLWPVQYIGFHGGTARTRAPAIADAIPGLSQTPPGAARTTHLVTRLAFLPNRSALQWL